MGRGELTDKAWARIEPLLPPIESGGRQWRDHRQVINAILWKLRTGAPWRDLPERYGPWKTAHERLRIWTADGTWDRILDQVIVKDDAVGNVEWTFSIDSSNVRAHQHSAGARERGLLPGPNSSSPRPCCGCASTYRTRWRSRGRHPAEISRSARPAR